MKNEIIKAMEEALETLKFADSREGMYSYSIEIENLEKAIADLKFCWE
jgi:hypothetical protein